MDTQDILLTIFTGILAVAVFFQTLIFLGIFRTFRRVTERMDEISRELLKNVEVVSDKMNETLATVTEIGNGLLPVKDKMVDAADIFHNRVVMIDDFLEETTNTARTEVLKMRDRLETAAERTEDLLEEIRSSIMVPVTEISAIVRGVRAGFDFLFRRRRNPPVAAHEDDEMFI